MTPLPWPLTPSCALHLRLQGGNVIVNIVVRKSAADHLPGPPIAEVLQFGNVLIALPGPRYTGNDIPTVDKAVAVGHPLAK